MRTLELAANDGDERMQRDMRQKVGLQHRRSMTGTKRKSMEDVRER